MTSLPIDIDELIGELNLLIHPKYKLVIALVDEDGIHFVDVCNRRTGNDINPRYLMITNNEKYPNLCADLHTTFNEAEEYIRKYGVTHG